MTESMVHGDLGLSPEEWLLRAKKMLKTLGFQRLGFKPAKFSSRRVQSETATDKARKPELVFKHHARDNEQRPADRKAVWAGIGDDGSADQGMAVMATTLTGVQAALRELAARFQRIREDLICLDDGTVKRHVGGRRVLEKTAGDSGRWAGVCDDVADRLVQSSPGWLVRIPDVNPYATSLADAAAALSALLKQFRRVSELRNAAVVHAKAVVEAAAVEERSTARGMVAKVLRTQQRLDFPIITEICAKSAGDKNEICSIVKLLKVALQDKNVDAVLRLKAVTLAHEMAYSDLARQAMVAEPSFVATLDFLAETSPARGIDHANADRSNAIDTSRVLASDLRRLLDEHISQTCPEEPPGIWAPPSPHRLLRLLGGFGQPPAIGEVCSAAAGRRDSVVTGRRDSVKLNGQKARAV